MKPITTSFSDEFMSVEDVLLERQAQEMQNQVAALKQNASATPRQDHVPPEPQNAHPANYSPQQPPMPDLHLDKNSELPDLESRKNLNAQTASVGPTTQDLINEKVNQDISNIKTTPSSFPKNPLDVLKSLIVKGEYKEDVVLFQQRWTLRALDQSDLLLALDEVNDMIESSVGRLTALAFAQVVYSLEAINGVSIYEMFKDTIKPTDFTTQMSYIIAVKKALRRYLEHFPPIVIDGLYNAYVEVDKKRNEALGYLKNS